jgi:hypothetical protein
MRRLLRRAGPDSDATSERGPERRSRRTAAPCAALLAISALLGPAAMGETLKEDELPNWIPSLGVGFGIHTRDVSARIDNPSNPFAQFAGINPAFGGAFLPTGVPINEAPFFCRPAGQFTGFCFFFDDDTTAVDGGSVPLGGQLIGPAEPFLGVVRPFVHGAFAIDFDSRVIAASGLKPAGFPTAGRKPRLRIQLEARPEHTWWVGGGLAVQIPIDRPLFLKLGYAYSQHQMELEGSIWRNIVINNQDTIERLNNYDELKIKGAGPTFGLEAEVWRIGSLAMNLSADLLVFFPSSGTDARFEVNTPLSAGEVYCSAPNPPSNCVQPAFLTVDADETQYHGSLTLRLTWLGISF